MQVFLISRDKLTSQVPSFGRFSEAVLSIYVFTADVVTRFVEDSTNEKSNNGLRA